MIMLVMQPINSRVCGQACVAMLLGITLDDAVRLMNRIGATNVKHLITPLLRNYTVTQTKLTRVKVKETLPHLGILRVRWNKRESHWIVKHADTIHDPLYGTTDITTYQSWLNNINARITSYLEVKPNKEKK